MKLGVIKISILLNLRKKEYWKIRDKLNVYSRICVGKPLI